MMIDFWKQLWNQQHASVKNARSASCKKMPMHAVHAAQKNDPGNPFFREHKSPHFAVEI